MHSALLNHKTTSNILSNFTCLPCILQNLYGTKSYILYQICGTVKTWLLRFIFSWEWTNPQSLKSDLHKKYYGAHFRILMTSWASTSQPANWKAVWLVLRYEWFQIHFQTYLDKYFSTRTVQIQIIKSIFTNEERFMSRIQLPSEIASSALHISRWG